MASAKTFSDIVQYFDSKIQPKVVSFLSSIVYKPDTVTSATAASSTASATIVGSDVGTAYGFSTDTEGIAVISAIVNLQARLAAVETLLRTAGMQR